MAEDDEPKSAYELILERLKKKDREDGVEELPVSEGQRARIAELRRVYEAKLAEREILFRSSLRQSDDPAEHEALEEQYRRERDRIASERDRRIEAVRGGGD